MPFSRALPGPIDPLRPLLPESVSAHFVRPGLPPALGSSPPQREPELASASFFLRLRRWGWVLTACALVLVYGPRLLSPGTHVDGTTYAILARNLAVGKGQPWNLYYGQPDGYWLPANAGDRFVDNPPLGIWIEAVFFRVLGDAWWVEELVSAWWLVAIALALARCWRLLHDDAAYRALDWLPVLGFGTGFYVRYCLGGNLLEGPLLVIGLLALGQALRALRFREDGRWAFVGVLLFGGILTKGPFLLFLWTLPAAYWFVLDRARPFRQAVLLPTGWLMGVPVLLFALGLLYEPFRWYWADFLDRQLTRSLMGTRANPYATPLTGRYFVGWVTAVNLLPLVALAGGLLLCTRIRPAAPLRRLSYFLALVGLGGLLPLGLIVRQNPQYALPSGVFFVLALSLWQAPALVALLARQSFRPVLVRAGLGLLVVGTVLGLGWQLDRGLTGNHPRQNLLISELPRLRYLPAGSVVATLDAEPIREDWFFNLLFNRHHRGELTQRPGRTPYLVVGARDPRRYRLPRAGYRLLDALPRSGYQFWVRAR
jgi:hypothetical protein